MTNDNKPSIFGPLAYFDQSTYEPLSGKTIWIAATDVRSLENKEVALDTLFGNCTTQIYFRLRPRLSV